jgi:predicted Zn-ribbon and HTH transcriptional regulator
MTTATARLFIRVLQRPERAENMGEIMMAGFQCERCEHKWVPREEGQVPTVCPKCKSPYWNKPRVRSGGKGAKAAK